LERKSTCASAGAVQQDFLLGLDATGVYQSLRCQHAGLGNLRILFKAHGRALVTQRSFIVADIIGEAAPTASQVAEHFISRPEARDLLSHRFYLSGDVRPENLSPRPGYAIEQSIDNISLQQGPIPIVNGNSEHP